MKKNSKKSVALRLEDILFNCRNYLRGKASVADKRDLMLTIVFLRFVGERFSILREEIRQNLIAKGYAEKDIPAAIDRPARYGRTGGFFLPPECRWETIANHPANSRLISDLDGVIATLEKDNPSLRGALPGGIFTSAGVSEHDLKKVIDEIGKVSHKNFPERDLIGRVYEYYLQAFAIQAKDAKEQGEFYTPHSIVNLIANLIEPLDGTIYDPCCGSGGMFVQSVKVIEAHGGNTTAVSVYGQESDPETFRLAKMNLAVRGISHNLGPRHLSTFERDFHSGTKMDYVMANPPFNLKDWMPSEEAIPNPLWGEYGKPPASNANYAWILHILHKLNPKKGIAGFLLANGALDDEDTLPIRKNLIEKDKIEAIIVLPREMFYQTDISVTLWVLNQNKRGGVWHGRKLRDRSGEVLFIDLRTWNTNIYEKKYVHLTSAQTDEVVKIYHEWQSRESEEYAKPELYRAVKKTELASNNYSLVPSRYIEFVDRDSTINDNLILSEASKSAAKLVSRQTENAKCLAAAFKAFENKPADVGNLETRQHKAPKIALGSMIEPCDERNSDEKYGVDAVRGVSLEKRLIPTKADMEGVKLTPYKLLKPREFCVVSVTSRNGGRISLAINDSEETYIVSSAYDCFRVVGDALLPEYLYLFLSRPEFDRYARFNSWGSAREVFSYADMERVEIPLPPIEVQKAVVALYRSTTEAKRIAEESAAHIKNIIPALVKWAEKGGGQ